MNPAIATLARYHARKAVKHQLTAQGRKLNYISARDIKAMAEAYLRDHPELFEKAAETVRNNPELRTLAERWERELRRNRP